MPASSSARQASFMTAASESLPMRMQTQRFTSPHPPRGALANQIPLPPGEGGPKGRVRGSTSFAHGLFALLERAITDVVAVARSFESNLRNRLIRLRERLRECRRVRTNVDHASRAVQELSATLDRSRVEQDNIWIVDRIDGHFLAFEMLIGIALDGHHHARRCFFFPIQLDLAEVAARHVQ